MASAATLDFDRLLAPVSEGNPAGDALKDHASLSVLYYKIKDARDAARQAERSAQQFQMLGEEESEKERIKPPEPPDWQIVIDLATDTLATKSKDLWIAAWLIEGLCRKQGFGGLRDGFRLARELLNRYWDGIHPRPDEDGLTTTVAQLSGLNGEDGEGALIAPIETIYITAGQSLGPFSSREYKQAANLAGGEADRRAQRIQQGAVTLEMIQSSANDSDTDFKNQLLDDVEQAISEFAQLTEILDQKCGAASPPSSQILAALTDCRDRVRTLYQSETALSVVDGTRTGGVEVTASGGPSGRVATRDEAFRLLLQVADFFRRTEPHSPVSYALEQAVRWGRMSLPELLTELVSDSTAREEMFRRTGIPRPPPNE